MKTQPQDVQDEAWTRAMRLMRKVNVVQLPKGVAGPAAEFSVEGVVGLGDRVSFIANHPELGMIIDGHCGGTDEAERESHRKANRDADALNALLFYAWRRGFDCGKTWCEERHTKGGQ